MNIEAGNLIDRLLASNYRPKEEGIILNNLLEKFQNGYPLKNIFRLIRSEDVNNISFGVWIASELGTKSCEIFDDISHLIESSDGKIRFIMSDLFAMCVTDSRSIKIALLLNDSEASVRWKAIDLLCRLSDLIIEQVIDDLDLSQKYPLYHKGLSLLPRKNKLSDKNLISLLMEKNLILKKFAFIKAVRSGSHRLKEFAKISGDSDLVDFVDDYEVL